MPGESVRSMEPAVADAVPGAGAVLAELGVELAGAVASLGAYGGGVYLTDPDADVLELAVLLGLPSAFSGPWRRVPLGSPLPVADAVRDGLLVWVGSADDLVRRYPRMALTLPYRFASACIPLTNGHRTYGALFLNWPGSHPPELDADERRTLHAAAQAMERSLDAADGLAATPLDEALVLSGVSGGVVGLSAAVEELTDALCGLDVDGRITWANAAAAGLLGRPVRDLVGALPWQVLPWLEHPMYEDRYRAAVMSREETGFFALCPPDRWLAFHLHPDTGGITVRIAPADASAAPGPAAHPAEPPAPVIPTRLGGVYHVLHLAGALTEAGGVREVVDLLTEQLLPAFDARAMLLLSYDPAGRPRIDGSRGYPHRLLESFEKRLTQAGSAAHTTAARALAEGVPIFVESRAELLRLYPEYADLSEGSAWAVLPLSARGRPTGACALSLANPHRFSAEERAVLTALGGLIGQAVARARAFDLAHDLAHGLQAALLPHRLPEVPGLEATARFRPGSEGMDVGGDFYDVIHLGHGQVAAVLGDVQGHNATAAALMGQIRTAVRAHAGAAPGQVLARTNRLLTDLDPGLFASAVYLHIDVAANLAVAARAGHPQPLLRRPDGSVGVVDLPGGLLLGIDPESTYPQTTVPLPAGAVLALFTDGLVDLPGVDPDDAVAGLGRRLAGPEESLDALADSLVPQTPSHDDTALLLLRLAGR